MTQANLTWGLEPTGDFSAAWGARAIYKRGYTEVTHTKTGRRLKHPRDESYVDIDLPPDRQGSWGDEAARKQLGTWINKKGLPALRKTLLKQYVGGDSDIELRIEDGPFLLRASPRQSHGYLYIVATMA